jgi:hypothetical protein
MYTCALSPGLLHRMQLSNAYMLRRVYSEVHDLYLIGWRSKLLGSNWLAGISLCPDWLAGFLCLTGCTPLDSDWLAGILLVSNWLTGIRLCSDWLAGYLPVSYWLYTASLSENLEYLFFSLGYFRAIS